MEPAIQAAAAEVRTRRKNTCDELATKNVAAKGTMMCEDQRLITTLTVTAMWAFFVLIFTQIAQFSGSKLGLPVRPSLIYCAIALTLLVAGALGQKHTRVLPPASHVVTISLLAALVIFGAFMFRGNSLQPVPGIKLMAEGAEWPSNLSYVIWPILNLATGVSLYLIAVRKEYRRYIIVICLSCLAIQIAAIFTDMIRPGTFGIDNGRGAGFAINPNPAAFIVTTLLCLALPFDRSECPRSFSVYIIIVTIAAVAFTGSRSGMICAAIVCAVWISVSVRSRSFKLPSPIFLGLGAAAVALLVFFSPALNPPDDFKAKVMFERTREAAFKKLMENETRPASEVSMDALPARPYEGPVVNTTRPIETLQQRFASAFTFDTSASHRLSALRDFSNLFRENPFGRGTGYTNMYEDGPHNTFLKLAVDEGVIAALLFLAFLIAATVEAVRNRSPAFLAIVAIGWINAMTSHNTLVEPLTTIAILLALGFVRNDSSPIKPSDPRSAVTASP